MTGAPRPFAHDAEAEAGAAAFASSVAATGDAVSSAATEQQPLVALAPRVRELGYCLFDYDAFVRELAPLLTLAVGAQDGGLFAAWVHVNLARLKHPERCTFLHEEDFDEEFHEFDISEYARFALTAFCEPETLRRLGQAVPAMHRALVRFGTDEHDAAQHILGEPVAHNGTRLTLSTGARVGMLPSGEPVERALTAARQTLAGLREPGASGRLLAVAPVTNGNNHDSSTNGSSGSGAHVSHRYLSTKALRLILTQWIELLEEASEYRVGVLYLYEVA